MRLSLEQRLEARTDRSDPEGCWPYVGGYAQRSGHKQISVDGRMLHVHRVAWMLANGPIPDGLCVCHHCDNPPCVRPDHLFLGTPRDNNRDRDRKGRHVALIGEAHGNAKLTERQVAAIKQLLADGVTHRLIAAAVGTSTGLIGYIASGHGWSHVNPGVLVENHGTLRSYNDGCRCDSCRSAMSIYRRKAAPA